MAEERRQAKKQVEDFFDQSNMKSNWQREVDNVAEYEEDFM